MRTTFLLLCMSQLSYPTVITTKTIFQVTVNAAHSQGQVISEMDLISFLNEDNIPLFMYCMSQLRYPTVITT